jgi:acyl carrier protein
MKFGEKRTHYEVVSDSLIDLMGVSQSEIDSGKSLRDLGADSLDLVELVMILEEAYNITIPDAVAEEFTNVNSIAAYLKSRFAVYAPRHE